MKKIALLLVVFVALLPLYGCGGGQDARHAGGRDKAAWWGLPKTKPDPTARRRIALSDKHGTEAVDLVYYRNGRYDPAAMRKINRLFRDKRANEEGDIDPELIDYLVDIRTRLNLPSSVTFEILDGYRTQETNEWMAQRNNNVALESHHMRGWAVDFRIQGVDGRAICEIAKTMQRGGVAYYPKDNHVHVDLGNIRTWREK
ncbi:MAG: DUF882 domain-containing protein [Bdellovibrionales bacterium]